MEIDKLSNKQFAQVFNNLIAKVKEDPLENFVKAPGFMDFTPTPPQEVIFKIVFQQKLDPITKKEVQIELTDDNGDFNMISTMMTETEIYEYMTERPYAAADLADVIINKINLICGRRAGKTTLSAILAIYCAISNNWKPYLKKHPFATVLILSHSREFSDEVLEVIRSFIEDSLILTRLINKSKRNTTSTLNLRTPWILPSKEIEWSRVQIKVGAASSKTTRGVAACAALCDEIAYWNLDENMKETDYKILKAVRPALKQFGKLALLIKLSSPGIKQGVLHGEYQDWKEGVLPASYTVFKAPSWMMNNILPKEEFIEEWKLDPDGFDTEYRANFADSLSNFIMPEFVDMAVMNGVQFNPPEDLKTAVTYKAAIDAAFKNDAFTFSIVGIVDGRVKQFVSKGWKGSRQNPISAYDVAEYIKTVTKQYGLDTVAADQYAYQPLREIFDRYGVTLEEVTFTPTMKKKIYYNLKKLCHSQQIDLLDNPIQSKELKELLVEQTPSGNIKIGHPQAGSDDYADSLATASFLVTEAEGTDLVTFNTADNVRSYGISVDKQGIAFGAPSPDLLVQSGHLTENVKDNVDSGRYIRDGVTGRLRIRTEEEMEEDEGDTGSQFSF